VTKDYGFSRSFDMPYEEAVEKVTAALKGEGFGVLTEIDVKATMKKKLDVEFRPYVILGACHPPLAHQALSIERQIGLLLPCNVIVYEDDDGRAVVSALNPMVALGVVDNPDLQSVAATVTNKLQRVIENLAQPWGSWLDSGPSPDTIAV
jgi:uncharacterized protein (DUF302 family)